MSEKFGQVWVLKAVEEGTGRPIEGVFDELRQGRARIGWSYEDDLDLRIIQDIRDKGGDHNERQNEAMLCRRFLTEVREGDLLLYPHQPKRDQFSVARVTGDYGYDGGIGGDFRSVRPCELITETPVDMYDEIVLSSLRRRMGKPRRLSVVNDTGPLKILLDSLSEAGQIQDGTNRVSIGRIHTKLREGLPDVIRQEFSGADFSRQFCSRLFERMDYDHDVQEGRGEAGSDIVVTVGAPLLPDKGFRVGVQAFAYEGDVYGESLEGKLSQLLEGWEANKLDYGVLLTTGIPTDEAWAILDSHNKENPQRHVKLIDGNMLADLFLQHFPPAEGGAGSGR